MDGTDIRSLSLSEREATIRRALQRARDERSKAAAELFHRVRAGIRAYANTPWLRFSKLIASKFT